MVGFGLVGSRWAGLVLVDRVPRITRPTDINLAEPGPTRPNLLTGVRNEAKKITAMIHTEYFDLDEDALQLGVRAMSSAVLDYLQRD